MKFNAMVQGSTVLAVAAVADRTGLFKVLAGAGPLTVAQIAEKGRLHPRYVQEVCSCLACAEFLSYDTQADTFVLPAAQARLLTDENFALNCAGWCDMVPSLMAAIPGVTQAMMNPHMASGVPFSFFSETGFSKGMSRVNGPGIKSTYIRKWLPSLPNSVEWLQTGIRVADLGTGYGALALALATAFPNSRITGIDIDNTSIERAKAGAALTSLTNINFSCKDVAQIEPATYDLITNHDCIHDLADPVGVLRAVRRALKPGGVFFSMEPRSGENLGENLSPSMAQGYAISTMHCMTVSLAQGGMGLGNAMGPKKYEALTSEAGFSYFSVVGHNAINNFYEIRGNTGIPATL